MDMDIQDLINAIQSGDAQNSNNNFNSIMADKMNVALNGRKEDIASSMYAPEATAVENNADV